MTVSELWEDYSKAKTKEVRNMIAKEYLGFVNYITSRMMIPLPSGLEKEDMVQYGFFGLIEAIENYDSKLGAKFETYAAMVIKGRIMDRVRDYGKKAGGPSRTAVKKSKIIEVATKSLEVKLGRSPLPEEIAEELEVTMDQYYKMLSDIGITMQISLDKMIGHDENMQAIEVIKNDSASTPEDRYLSRENGEVLAKAIDEMPEKERMIVIFYYYEELTLKEIGKQLNLSESRISQLHTQAMLRLRNKIQGGE